MSEIQSELYNVSCFFPLATPTDETRIILQPPSFLNFVPGTNVTVPCVTSDLSTPVFTILVGPAETQTTMGGLNVIQPDGVVSLTCQGATTPVTVLSSSSPLGEHSKHLHAWPSNGVRRVWQAHWRGGGW